MRFFKTSNGSETLPELNRNNREPLVKIVKNHENIAMSDRPTWKSIAKSILVKATG